MALAMNYARFKLLMWLAGLVLFIVVALSLTLLRSRAMTIAAIVLALVLALVGWAGRVYYFSRDVVAGPKRR